MHSVELQVFVFSWFVILATVTSHAAYNKPHNHAGEMTSILPYVM